MIYNVDWIVWPHSSICKEHGSIILFRKLIWIAIYCWIRGCNYNVNYLSQLFVKVQVTEVV